MLDSLAYSFINLAQSSAEITTLDRIKDLVNRVGAPQYSLPIFVLVFLAAYVFYRKWTKPMVFWPLMGLFGLVYFGMIFKDHNYAAICCRRYDYNPGCYRCGQGG